MLGFRLWREISRGFAVAFDVQYVANERRPAPHLFCLGNINGHHTNTKHR